MPAGCVLVVLLAVGVGFFEVVGFVDVVLDVGFVDVVVLLVVGFVDVVL